MMLINRWKYRRLVKNTYYHGNEFGYNFEPIDALNFIRDISRKGDSFGAKLNQFMYFLMATKQSLNPEEQEIGEEDAKHDMDLTNKMV